MNTQSFTTSSAVVETDNFVVRGGHATPDARDFLLLCKDGNVAEAIHALYYLPLNYKLMIMPSSADSSVDDASWTEDISLKGRVQFGDVDAVGYRAYVGAIISDDANAETVKSATSPYVVVSATAQNGIMLDGIHGLTVQSGNPEALASAILHISRKN